MTGRKVDLAIVGGGLAGGLIALAVHRRHPGMDLALFEAGASPGGNHRWSWFASDLDAEGAELMRGFSVTEWDQGYQVHFPQLRRDLRTPYRSLASTDFADGLQQLLPAGAIRTACPVGGLAADHLVLGDGTRIEARAVIDCRTFAPSEHLRGGWQVFMGRHLRTNAPHGVDRPIVMDATVEQPDAYRFVYVLPLGAHDLLVEDTYYADRPVLDRATLASRIDAYCRARGWDGTELGTETGVLPVITGGDFAAYRRALGRPDVALAGARGGFTHPLTSYTLPIAVANALAIARVAERSGAELAALVEQRASRHWRATRFYRALGRMLFDAARPSDRYRIFQRFYGLPEPLIERFYAARSSAGDRARILAGRPPVAIGAAVRALLGKGTPLVHEGSR